MFDMLKVGRNIVRLRGLSGLTQMGLADQLGISYQAVSNWERGNSMPDISKLPQLAEIFGTGIDEILGEEQGQGSRVIGSVLEHGGTDYFERGEGTAQELSDLAPILHNEQIGEAFEHVKDGAAVEDLLALAPFLSEETLDSCAKLVFEREGMEPLLKLAPFVSEEAMDELAKLVYAAEGLQALVSLAPYISDEQLDQLAVAISSKEGVKALLPLAPFLSEEILDSLAAQVFNK